MIMCRLLAAVALLSVYVVRAAHKDLGEQIKRMNSYETTHLSPVLVDEDTMTIDFDAFGQHYAVELKRQTHAAPSNVTHTNVAEEVHGPVSSVEESCHWQGSVSNDEGVSVVSASLCSGRGIRARISAFDEILIIKPSAYYLDLAKDALQAHGLEDEVLMYRVSEFDRPDVIGTVGVVPEADDILIEHGVDMRRRLVKNDLAKDQSQPSSQGDDLLMEAGYDDIEGLRRRLYTATDPAQTEVAVIIGPARTANYQIKHGDEWYSALFFDTQDMLNAVDAIYAATDWNANDRNSIGGVNALRVIFSEIHVIYSFTGIYTSMAPQKLTPDDCPLADNGMSRITYIVLGIVELKFHSVCVRIEYDSSDDCAVDFYDYLNKAASWIAYNMELDEYDDVHLITDMKFSFQEYEWEDGTTSVISRGKLCSIIIVFSPKYLFSLSQLWDWVCFAERDTFADFEVLTVVA